MKLSLFRDAAGRKQKYTNLESVVLFYVMNQNITCPYVIRQGIIVLAGIFGCNC